MRSIHCAVRAALWGTPDLNGSFAWAWDEHGPAVVIELGMDWTTYFAKGRQERSLPGVVLDVESLDGIDIGAERTNRVQITATSDHVLSVEDMPNLVEFLDVAARALGRCAAGPPCAAPCPIIAAAATVNAAPATRPRTMDERFGLFMVMLQSEAVGRGPPGCIV